jgi:hypothetical protein
MAIGPMNYRPASLSPLSLAPAPRNRYGSAKTEGGIPAVKRGTVLRKLRALIVIEIVPDEAQRSPANYLFLFLSLSSFLF